MVEVLDDKRTATRFRILVEIADRQPAVSQGEIAEEVGVTNQAVSEYIRELVEEGLVEKEARSRYRITREGVDWLFRVAVDVRRFADHVTDDLLGSMDEDAAIATASIDEGESVSLFLEGGLLHARPGADGPATGVATTAAEPGQDVGVSEFRGVIDLDPGTVTVLRVPPIRSGGSRETDDAALSARAETADLVLASGVEAIVALRRVGVEPAVTFSAGTVAADAAERGLDVLVVATADDVGRVTDALRDSEASYVVTERDSTRDGP